MIIKGFHFNGKGVSSSLSSVDPGHRFLTKWPLLIFTFTPSKGFLSSLVWSNNEW